MGACVFFFVYICLCVYVRSFTLIFMCVNFFIFMFGLVVLVLWYINLCWLFNAKSIFIQIISSIFNYFNHQKRFYFKLFSLIKLF